MSIRYQYASGRQQLCALNLTKGSGNLTSATAGTYYLWIQGRNDIGYNLFSEVSSISLVADDSLIITIPADCFRDGENWRLFTISINTTNDPGTSTVLFSFDALDTTQVNPTPRSLPFVLTLTEDSQLQTTTDRGAQATLPTSDLVEGMLVNYTPTGLIYRYAPDSTRAIDGLYTLSAGIAGGRWLYFPDGTSTYITDTTDNALGCDIDVSDPEVSLASVLNLDYALDGSEGYSRKLWINNSTETVVAQGTLVGLSLTIGGIDVSSFYTGLLKVVFEGYVNTTTGELDIYESNGITQLPLIGAELEYVEGKTELNIFKDLDPGRAYQLRVFPEFNIYELRQKPPEGAQLAIYPYLFRFASKPSELAVFLGNYISNANEGKRRIYPSVAFEAIADTGSGFVNGRSFSDIGASDVFFIQEEQVDQKIIVNSDGAVYREDPSVVLDTNEALRALASTEVGETIASAASAAVTASDTDTSFSITVTHPTAIRGDYPDVIAGKTVDNTVLSFTASSTIFYISDGTELRKFTTVAPAYQTASQQYELTWSTGTVVAEYPTTAFGFWTPSVPVIDSVTVAGSTSYTARVSYGFNGSIVTNISHSTSDGCIPEFLFNLAELSEIGAYWGPAVADLTELNALDTTDIPNGQFRFVLAEETLYRYDKIADEWLEYSGGSGGGGITLTVSNDFAVDVPTTAGDIHYNETLELAQIAIDDTSVDDWRDLSFNPDRILTDENGSILVDENGNILYL